MKIFSQRVLVSGLLFLGIWASARAAGFEYWPGAEYDPAIPSIEKVLGYAPGTRITPPHLVIRYFEALAAAAPDRIRIQDYGTTWEGRRLIYVALSSAANIARLETVADNMHKLRDVAATDDAAAEKLIASLPGSLWLMYSVHGNEISSTDAAMLTAYHLLAAKNDPRTGDILEKTIVFIDPVQNPDGRQRFVQHFQQTVGLVADESPLSAEHIEPWPGGRANHYLFDLNRDWFALTQPETRGKVDAIFRYLPLAVIDLHEMGSNETYYFSPEAVPYNPHIATDQRASLQLFGHNNARWFDRFGFDYFTREVYDAFYPGYGAAWPSYYGGIAMTYEQASSRGLRVRRRDGTAFQYRDTVRHHFVTSLSSAEVVAKNSKKFLREFRNYAKSAVAEGRREANRYYILPTQADQDGADKLAAVLSRQGVAVQRATASFAACKVDYAAGTYVIDAAQPAKRLIRTLLEVDVPIDGKFMAEQERRRAKGLPDQIYDTTAWSLPLMYNLSMATCGRLGRIALQEVDGQLHHPGNVSDGDAAVAWLVPWGQASSVRFLSAALRAGLQVKSTDAAFTNDGKRYPAGSLIVSAAENAGAAKQIEAIATQSGARVTGVDDSWVTDGPNFGSIKVHRFVAPRIAMLWDTPTGSSAAGNARFVIERQFGYPVSVIRTRSIGGADLGRFDVLIMPDSGRFGGGYGAVLGKRGTATLKTWVKGGGTLIGIGGALRYLSAADTGLLSSRREDAVLPAADDKKGPGAKDKGTKDKGTKAKAATVPGTALGDEKAYRAALRPPKKSPDNVPGVLARAAVDGDHWLGAGLAKTLNVLVGGGDIYAPVALDKGVNVVRFLGPDDLLASGYLWQENRRQLAYKPFVMAENHGRGTVIAFTQNPTTRGYLDGLDLVFMNALFRGPAHSRKQR